MASNYSSDSTQQPEPGYSNTEPGSPAATPSFNNVEQPKAKRSTEAAESDTASEGSTRAHRTTRSTSTKKG